MKKNFLILLVFLLAPVLLSQVLWAKVYIDIRSPSFRKFPIALAPFKALTPPSQDMKLGERGREILREDLDISGFFSLLTPETSPEKTEGAPSAPERGTAPESPDFQPWANLGAEALVTGVITYKDGSLTLEARLYDVVKKELIVGKRYIGEVTDLSRMVHRFADEIIFALTGEQGIFQTQIIFVSTVGKNKELFLMDWDGRNVTQITHHNSIILSPRVSPDGTKVVFTSYKMGNPDLFIKDLRTGEERRISNYPGLEHVSGLVSGRKTAGPDAEQGWKPGDLYHESGWLRPRAPDESSGYRCFSHLVSRRTEDRFRLQSRGESPDLYHGGQRAECSTFNL